jgi:hypothetical protein
MNQIISTLIAKSGLEWCAQTEQDKQNLEEFAKLLIEECARVQHSRFCKFGDVSWDILMQHFGVGK